MCACVCVCMCVVVCVCKVCVYYLCIRHLLRGQARQCAYCPQIRPAHKSNQKNHAECWSKCSIHVHLHKSFSSVLLCWRSQRGPKYKDHVFYLEQTMTLAAGLGGGLELIALLIALESEPCTALILPVWGGLSSVGVWPNLSSVGVWPNLQYKYLKSYPGDFLFSRIWSSAQDHAVQVLLLNIVSKFCFFISNWPRWSFSNFEMTRTSGPRYPPQLSDQNLEVRGEDFPRNKIFLAN